VFFLRNIQQIIAGTNEKTTFKFLYADDSALITTLDCNVPEKPVNIRLVFYKTKQEELE